VRSKGGIAEHGVKTPTKNKEVPAAIQQRRMGRRKPEEGGRRGLTHINPCNISGFRLRVPNGDKDRTRREFKKARVEDEHWPQECIVAAGKLFPLIRTSIRNSKTRGKGGKRGSFQEKTPKRLRPARKGP